MNPLQLKLPRLLVATDFSCSSETALRSAIVLANRLSAQVVLVHVSEPSGSSRSEPFHIDESSRKRIDSRFHKVLSAFRVDQGGSTGIVIQRNAVEGILDQAKRVEADLIVVGPMAVAAYNYSGLEAWQNL